MGTRSNKSLLGVIAFAAMLLCALLYLIQALDRAIDAVSFNGSFMNAISLIAKCCLYFVVAVVAYGYVSDKKPVWQIIYWVIVVVFIVTVVLNIRFW